MKGLYFAAAALAALLPAVLFSAGGEAASYYERAVHTVAPVSEPESVGEAAEPAQREAYTLIDVPFFLQEEYPTGCELVSTSMLLSYYGYDITAQELISGGYVGTKKITYSKKGVAYGGDPNEVFVGDPYSENGYGCFSGAIIGALRKILP